MEKHSLSLKDYLKQLEMTQKEFSVEMGISESTLSLYNSSGEVPQSIKNNLELRLENKDLKEKIRKILKAKEIIDNL